MKYFPGFRIILIVFFILACNTKIYGAHLGDNSYQELFLHYTISTAISFTSCRLLTLYYPEMTLTNKYMISTGVGVLVGVGKEVFDANSGKHFDFIDIGFDLLGIATGLVLHYYIFDKKNTRSNLSFRISDQGYVATLKISF
jgi:hypothetical protein